MKHPFKFVISPLGDKRYERERNNIIVNTGIEDAKYVNRYGVVKAVPYTYEGKIKKGDIVIVHHNVFRDVYDMNGNFKHSNSNSGDNNFLVLDMNIFMYKKPKGKWTCNNDNCFVKPHEKELTGYIKYSNIHHTGKLIGFTPESEYEFYIDGEKLYKMRESDIAIVHEKP